MSRRLALHGASQEDAARLRDMLQQCAGVLNAPWSLLDTPEADLLVVDIDSVYGHMDWLRAHSSGKPVAAFTQNPRFDEADLILHKPLDKNELAGILNSVDAHAPLRPEPEATVAKEIENADPVRITPVAAKIAAIVPPPVADIIEVTPPPPAARKLCDWLADGALAQAMRLELDGAPVLTLDPGNRTYYADGTGRALAPYFQSVITLDVWQPVEYAELAALQASGKGQPYSRLLWLHHALGSNGHLVSELDIEAKYKLSRWPQIEREFPKHFRIATVMMKQPATLTEIADQSGANLADVIDFTNAYNASGHIEMEPVVAAPVTRDSGRGAILSRLRNPFGAN
ncbi:MAG: hypothetical protein ABJB01_11555 [Rudaea sp.]